MKVMMWLVSLAGSLLVAAVLFALPVTAQEPAKLAVMSLEDKTGDLSPQLVDDLTDCLRTEIARRSSFVVIDKSRQSSAMKQMVGEARKDSYAACYDESCQIPLGKALSADTVLRVKLIRIGSTYQFSAEMIDLAKEAVDPGAAALVEFAAMPSEGRDDRLLAGIKDIARQVAGAAPEQRPFSPETDGAAGSSASRIVERRIGEVPEAWEAEATTGVVVGFSSEPRGAAVLVDGVLRCPASPCSKTIGQGWHDVEMQLEGYKPRAERVLIVDSNRAVAMTLEANFGWLSVLSEPPGLPVTLDGKGIGSTPVSAIEVASGPHTVMISSPQHYEAGEQINIALNEHRIVKLGPVPREGVLVVEARDADGNDVEADIWLNGGHIGKTPLSKQVLVGAYTVKATYQGAAWTHPVNIVEKYKTTATAEFTRAQPTPRSSSPEVSQLYSAPRSPPPTVAVAPKRSNSPKPSASASAPAKAKTAEAEHTRGTRVGLDVSVAVLSADNENAELAFTFPIHLGLIVRDVIQLGGLVQLGGVSNSHSPPTDEEDEADGSISFAGIFAASAMLWLPRKSDPLAIFLEGMVGYSHVSKRCLEWVSDGTTEKGGVSYACHQWGQWGEEQEDGGLATGFKVGLKLGSLTSSSSSGWIVGGLGQYQASLGWGWGGFVGMTFY